MASTPGREGLDREESDLTYRGYRSTVPTAPRLHRYSRAEQVRNAEAATTMTRIDTGTHHAANCSASIITTTPKLIEAPNR